jgi:hypothetical protein
MKYAQLPTLIEANEAHTVGTLYELSLHVAAGGCDEMEIMHCLLLPACFKCPTEIIDSTSR